MDKEKKKTLTISSNLKKKIDTSSITGGKKAFSVEKNSRLGQTNSLTRQAFFQIQAQIKKLRKRVLQENLLSNKLLKILLKKIISQQERAN